MNEVVRVGIAGLGRSGWGIHAATIGAMQEQFRIVAVTDTDPARMKQAADRLGCRTHDTFDSLIADEAVELVVVATPSHLHESNAIQALRAGRDVVCEKPMATSLEEADRMIAAAEETGRTLAVFHNRRYDAGLMKTQEVIRSGVLGRIVLIRIVAHHFGRRWDWQTLKEQGGGSLNNTGSHFLDQALTLFGGADPEIFCHLEKTLTSGDTEDHCKILLRAPGEPMLDLEFTSCCAFPQDTYLVMGTSGGLTGNVGTVSWKWVDFSGLQPRPVDTVPTSDRSYNREDLPWQEETWTAPLDRPSTPTLFYRDLYRTLRQGAPLFVTPESVRRQMAILDHCHRTCPVWGTTE